MNRIIAGLLLGAFFVSPALAGQEVTLFNERGQPSHENYPYIQGGGYITADGALPAPVSGIRRGVDAYCPSASVGGTVVLTLQGGGTSYWTIVTGNTQNEGMAAVSVTGLTATGCQMQSIY